MSVRRRVAWAVLAVGLVAGCSKKDPGGPGALWSAPDNEDPDVLAAVKAKGWMLLNDQRLSDGKRLVFLSVENPDKGKAFEDFALAPDDYALIARSKSVQVLDLRKVKTTDAGLKVVAGIPQLEGIIVGGEEATDAGMKALAGCKTLDDVTLMTKKVTDAGVRELAALPKLHRLHLMFMTLDGSGLAAFAGSPTLEAVTLDYVDGMTDAGVKHLAKIPNLKALKLGSGFGSGSKVTAAGIRAIVDARLPAKFEFDSKLIDDDLFAALVAKGWLYGPSDPGDEKAKKPATAADVTSVSLDGSKVTDKGFAAVLPCTNVTSLFLSKSGITDESLKKLGGFGKLSYLSLGGTKVTAAGLEAVAGLPIKHLALENCELTEDAFKAFGRMRDLEELWLPFTKMKAEWLKHLAGLPKLKDLNLQNAAFDDAAVPTMASLPSLKELAVHSTKLTDVGFAELLKLPNLKRLMVDGTPVTKAAYQKAKKDHPGISFYYYRYDQ